jgi:hypothetical protein
MFLNFRNLNTKAEDEDKWSQAEEYDFQTNAYEIDRVDK